ncbi:unnamed protein product, partial [Didymodactylos carnosus]
EIGSAMMIIMNNNKTSKNEKSNIKTKIFELVEKFIKKLDNIDNNEKFINEEKMKLFCTRTLNRQDFWELMIKNGIFTNYQELFLIANKEIENKNYNKLTINR